MSLENQLPADSQTFNEPNLAIKGIIGVKALSAIASVLKSSDDASNYSAAASSMYNDWTKRALDASSHSILAQLNGSQKSYSTGYNLFMDKWLNLSVVSEDIYDAQTKLVSGLLGPGNTYGIPTDSTAGRNVTASWNMFVSALVNDETVQSNLISKLRNLVDGHVDPKNSPWPLVYAVDTGKALSGQSSPGQGAVFAPIALSLPARLAVDLGSSTLATSSRSDVGAIAGGIVGSVLGLTVLAAILVSVYRRRGIARPHRPVRENSAGVPIATTYPSSDPTSRITMANTHVEPFLVPGGWPDSGRPISSKALVNYRHAQSAPSQSSSEPVTVTSCGAPTSTARSGSEEAVSLLADMNAMRRELAEMRAVVFELPPNYVSRASSVAVERDMETS